MHVLQIAWEYPPYIIGGLGRHVAELVPALAAHGVQVTVLAPRLSGGPLNEMDQGITVHRVEVPEMPRADFPGFVAHTNQLLIQAALALQSSAGRFDLIHAHDWLAADVGTALKHHWKIPLVATIHATERGRGRGGLHSLAAHRINDLEWHLSYEAWRVIVCSHFMARQVQDYFQTPADKIDIVPNGVNIGRSPFNDAEHWLEFRRRYVADDERMVFHVGRIVFEKGLHTLLDAWPTISRRLLARLVIAGTGDYLEALKARAAALGIGSTVRFAGFITNEDRDRLYHAADLAIFPSLYEPFGIVALEALANACPLIVSDAGGLAEVVQHGITGLIVPADNPGALADAVIATLDRPEIARARAGAALNEIRDYYTWSRIAWLTLAVYQQVLNEWDTTSWGKELPVT
ncbi:glycosyltransferase family 4 protein [Candidatus Chloroploca sp. M-50]|uniref:Glycosyltransferase family 4 protein n=1 Tax=Candidatus Chloroploca mongolica TaxID=2528176 RepID=A0ABS4DFF1_9CHLR|nr:glycosyltransferase family 4 protein [Candidatus Chloroploca mongolica]MBP1468150.1 glycosyltransferase family 4 protein [Candidatus Chloroploca mongolica]